MIVAGVDEVGRGPLAGPVVTAAVILKEPIDGLKDSKKLTPENRARMAEVIISKAACYAYGRAEVAEIEKLNIHNATLLAMKRAVEGLKIMPDKVLVDGGFIPSLSIPCYAVVKGDGLIDEISAASILAKVQRDEEMIQMDAKYPGYGFAAHKGYATKLHQEKLIELGPSAIHRVGFTPVSNLLKKS